MYPKRGRFSQKTISKDGAPLSSKATEKELNQLIEDLEKDEKDRKNSAPPKPNAETNIIRYGFGKFAIGLLDFLLAGDFSKPRLERRDGRETIVLNFRPRQGYRPPGNLQSPIANLAGVIWIDAADRVVVDLKAWPAQAAGEPAVAISLTRLPEGLWVPASFQVNTTGYQHAFNGESVYEVKEFSNYRKFDVKIEEVRIGEQVDRKK